MSILEIIRFRPLPGATDALLAGRAAAVAALTDRFGMEHSTLCHAEDGTWVDVMRFPSAAAADEALAHEMELVAFAGWVANVEAVLSRERVTVQAP